MKKILVDSNLNSFKSIIYENIPYRYKSKWLPIPIDGKEFSFLILSHLDVA